MAAVIAEATARSSLTRSWPGGPQVMVLKGHACRLLNRPAAGDSARDPAGRRSMGRQDSFQVDPGRVERAAEIRELFEAFQEAGPGGVEYIPARKADQFFRLLGVHLHEDEVVADAVIATVIATVIADAVIADAVITIAVIADAVIADTVIADTVIVMQSSLSRPSPMRSSLMQPSLIWSSLMQPS
jgi:hypothetical protein